MSKFWSLLNYMKKEDNYTKGNQMSPGDKKKKGLGELLYFWFWTVRLWNSQSKAFWRALNGSGRPFVTFLGNTKQCRPQGEEHQKPGKASGRAPWVWTLQLHPLLAMQASERYLLVQTSVSPSVNGTMSRSYITGWLWELNEIKDVKSLKLWLAYTGAQFMFPDVQLSSRT